MPKSLSAFDAAQRRPSTTCSPSYRLLVSLVRIAATHKGSGLTPPSNAYINRLSHRNNSMQVHALTSEDLLAPGVPGAVQWVLSRLLCRLRSGFWNPSDIAPISSASPQIDGPIGCHLHDNRGLAMANTLAVDRRRRHVGGRNHPRHGSQPGNARTEYLAIELTRRGLLDIDLTPLIPVVESDFAALHQEFEWGTNLHYMLSGTHAVHPTYVQRMIADPRFSPAQIVETIERLGVDGGRHSIDRSRRCLCDVNKFRRVVERHRLPRRPVLIIGPGATVSERRDDLEHMITSSDAVVLNLNLRPSSTPELLMPIWLRNPVRAST